MSITDVIFARENEIDRLKSVNRALRRKLDAKQAKIDALMLEWCPNEMTARQRKTYEKHQQPVRRAEVVG